MGCFVQGGKNGMGCFVRVDKNCMGCFDRGVKKWHGMFCHTFLSVQLIACLFCNLISPDCKWGCKFEPLIAGMQHWSSLANVLSEKLRLFS